jgi:hypothetical protein
MSGGTIRDNQADNGGVYGIGGGVGVDGGNFSMSGGTIRDNTASNRGGGVYVNSGTFSMSGGTIHDNTATIGDGGGVYVDSGGTFTKSGGTIYGAPDSNANIAGGAGQAAYALGKGRKESTAWPGDILDSSISHPGGGWDFP